VQHIIIVGSGIIGLTSAYQAIKRGYRVTMLESKDGPALGASYQNGGQLSYSHAVAVSHAANWCNFIKATSSSQSVIEFSWLELFKKISWFKALYKSKKYADNKSFFAFSSFSKDEFSKLKDELKYEGVNNCGTLHLFRNKRSLASFIKLVSSQDNHKYKKIESSSLGEYCKNINEDEFSGGVFFPGDQSGDARVFSKKIFTHLDKQKHFSFYKNSEVKNIVTKAGIVTNILLESGAELVADKYIISAGSYSSKLIEKLNLTSPIIPVKGYSTNLQNIALSTALIDSDVRMVYTNLGGAVRVAGLYDFHGFKQGLTKGREKVFDKSLNSLFKVDVTVGREKLWHGFRAVSQDGFPVIGKSQLFSNLYYNIGHANLGWTLSAGSAKILIEEIAEKDNKDFGFLRANRFKI